MTRRGVAILMVLLMAKLTFAGGLADRVQDAYRKTDSFSAKFTQKTMVELLDRETTESGELVFAKPGRFSIHYEGKRERQYLSDGDTLWIYHPKEKEVEVVNDVQDLVSREALVFLGGLGEMTKEFKVSDSGVHELTLVPKSKSSPFSKIILIVDPSDFLARGTTLYPKSGNKSEYSFSDVRANEPVSESTFKFSKSGVKEIHPMAVE
jgi:outer membrane lipoprotein carrier protein